MAEERDGRVFDPAEPPAAALAARTPARFFFLFLLGRAVMAEGLEEKLEEGLPLEVGGQDVPSRAGAPLLAEERPKVQGRHDPVQEGRRHARPVLLQDGEAKFAHGPGDQAQEAGTDELVQGGLGLGGPGQRLHEGAALEDPHGSGRAGQHVGQKRGVDVRPVEADGAEGVVHGHFEFRRGDDLCPVKEGPEKDWINTVPSQEWKTNIQTYWAKSMSSWEPTELLLLDQRTAEAQWTRQVETGA